jgi:tight adherence protein B
MGAALGLVLGAGLFLVLWSFQPRRSAPAPRRRRPRTRDRIEDMLRQAGIESVSARGLVGSCLGVGLAAFVVVSAVSRTPVIGLSFGVIAGFAPVALVRYRQRQRRNELRELWPEAVDNLASAVRAGLSLPEAVAQLGVRGPEPLRRAFQRFGEDYRATGRFYDCLDRLKAALADPVGDRIVESLRMAREVGGSDLGRLLRTLSTFLREDARTRAELETRQGWTVNAARLAVAAPWALLLLLSLRTDAVRAYNSATGVLVLAIGGGVCFVAYRLMVRIGRLPDEERVLR